MRDFLFIFYATRSNSVYRIRSSSETPTSIRFDRTKNNKFYVFAATRLSFLRALSHYWVPPCDEAEESILRRTQNRSQLRFLRGSGSLPATGRSRSVTTKIVKDPRKVNLPTFPTDVDLASPINKVERTYRACNSENNWIYKYIKNIYLHNA